MVTLDSTGSPEKKHFLKAGLAFGMEATALLDNDPKYRPLAPFCNENTVLVVATDTIV